MVSSCRYVQVHQSACTPSYTDRQGKELTSQEVNAELARWKPSYDYGTDSVFSVTPPTVSPQDMALYEKSCRVAVKGPLPSILSINSMLDSGHQICDSGVLYSNCL